MTNPAPKKPNKVTYRVSPDGLTIDVHVESYGMDPVVPEDLKPILEARKRARQQKAAESDQPPPATNDKPPQ